MYEFLTGEFPFQGQGVSLYKSIMNAEFKKSDNLSQNALDLISNLLKIEVINSNSLKNVLGFLSEIASISNLTSFSKI